MKSFCFDQPITSSQVNHGVKTFQFQGNVTIEGQYEDFPGDNEILPYTAVEVTSVRYNNQEILPVLDWLADGAVTELDKIYNSALSHIGYLEGTKRA